MIDFAQGIAPPNWQFIALADFGKAVLKPRAMVIQVWTYSDEGFDEDEEEQFCGMAKPITLRPVSLFADAYVSAKKAYERYGDFLIASSEIKLNDAYLDESTMLHEIAHVAASRMAMRYRNRRNDSFSIYSHKMFEKDNDEHGEIFQSAYAVMINRAEKTYGYDLIWHNRADLEMYRERTAQKAQAK
jgi:hypothetical protein